VIEESGVQGMIVGDMDSASKAALRCGAELVVHAFHDGRAPGADRLRGLGLDFEIASASGLSEDLALLIAAERGAKLIVSVGYQLGLVGFLDRNREGMSSSFLTRLRLGEILIDARGVSLVHALAGAARL
jgi:uncharacterized membrane-anchored protein